MGNVKMSIVTVDIASAARLRTDAAKRTRICSSHSNAFLFSRGSMPVRSAQAFQQGTCPFRRGVALQKDRARAHTSPALVCTASVVEPGSTVLVAGATGGVGQLLTSKLIERGYQVRALSRSPDKAEKLLGKNIPGLQVVLGDLRDQASLKAAFQGVDAMCISTGTTAFPSKRWDNNNSPEQADFVAIQSLTAVLPRSLKRVIMTSSAGVERSNQFPFFILNLFGVLKYKKAAEDMVKASGVPYTILRPGRLTDGPYTSYDLNTLTRAISGTRQSITMSAKDDLIGETSRIAVAEAMVQALQLECTTNRVFSLESKEGSGPGQDKTKWEQLFLSVA